MNTLKTFVCDICNDTIFVNGPKDYQESPELHQAFCSRRKRKLVEELGSIVEENKVAKFSVKVKRQSLENEKLEAEAITFGLNEVEKEKEGLELAEFGPLTKTENLLYERDSELYWNFVKSLAQDKKS